MKRRDVLKIAPASLLGIAGVRETLAHVLPPAGTEARARGFRLWPRRSNRVE